MSVWGWFLEFGPFAIGLLAILFIAISVRVLGFVAGRGKQRNVLGELSVAIPFVGLFLVWAVCAQKGRPLTIGSQGFGTDIILLAIGAFIGVNAIIWGRSSGRPIGLAIAALTLCLALIAAPAVLSILLVSH
jgi:hypothetical protein